MRSRSMTLMEAFKSPPKLILKLAGEGISAALGGSVSTGSFASGRFCPVSRSSVSNPKITSDEAVGNGKFWLSFLSGSWLAWSGCVWLGAAAIPIMRCVSKSKAHAKTKTTSATANFLSILIFPGNPSQCPAQSC